MCVALGRYCTNSMGCKIMNITLVKSMNFQTACLDFDLNESAEITT
jgi:hypothetical protein